MDGTSETSFHTVTPPHSAANELQQAWQEHLSQAMLGDTAAGHNVEHEDDGRVHRVQDGASDGPAAGPAGWLSQRAEKASRTSSEGRADDRPTSLLCDRGTDLRLGSEG